MTVRLGVRGDTEAERSDGVGVAGATETRRGEDMATQMGYKPLKFSLLNYDRIHRPCYNTKD